jgi:hypothetical protein
MYRVFSWAVTARQLFCSHNQMTVVYIFVRMKGLEPPRLSAPDPKSGAATNYATSACG